MRIIELADKFEIQVYATSQELPLERYSKFQKYQLFASGVGSDMKSISEHLEKLYMFLNQNMTDDAKLEAENLHYNIFSVVNEHNFDALCFACRLYSVGGELFTDLSEENLTRTLTLLSDKGLTQAIIVKENNELKKKSPLI